MNRLISSFRVSKLLKKELLKATTARELLLMKRNSFVYIFKLTQLIIMAFVGFTLFFRTEMSRDNESGGNIYVAALFFAVVQIMFNGMAELAMIIAKLPVFFKQRDLLFFPAWSYAITSWILKIPVTLLEVSVWVILTYYVIGFEPNVGRFFKHFLILIFLNQTASALFRAIGAAGRDMIIANTFGSFALLLLFALGGFILSRADIEFLYSDLTTKKIENGNPIPFLMETIPYCPDFMLGYDTNSNIYVAMPDKTDVLVLMALSMMLLRLSNGRLPNNGYRLEQTDFE